MWPNFSIFILVFFFSYLFCSTFSTHVFFLTFCKFLGYNTWIYASILLYMTGLPKLLEFSTFVGSLHYLLIEFAWFSQYPFHVEKASSGKFQCRHNICTAYTFPSGNQVPNNYNEGTCFWRCSIRRPHYRVSRFIKVNMISLMLSISSLHFCWFFFNHLKEWLTFYFKMNQLLSDVLFKLGGSKISN